MQQELDRGRAVVPPTSTAGWSASKTTCARGCAPGRRRSSRRCARLWVPLIHRLWARNWNWAGSGCLLTASRVANRVVVSTPLRIDRSTVACGHDSSPSVGLREPVLAGWNGQGGQCRAARLPHGDAAAASAVRRTRHGRVGGQRTVSSKISRRPVTPVRVRGQRGGLVGVAAQCPSSGAARSSASRKASVMPWPVTRIAVVAGVADQRPARAVRWRSWLGMRSMPVTGETRAARRQPGGQRPVRPRASSAVNASARETARRRARERRPTGCTPRCTPRRRGWGTRRRGHRRRRRARCRSRAGRRSTRTGRPVGAALLEDRGADRAGRRATAGRRRRRRTAPVDLHGGAGAVVPAHADGAPPVAPHGRRSR